MVETGIAIGAPVVLLGEDAVEAIGKIGLQERVARRGVIVVILLGEDGAGSVAGDNRDDALLDARLANDVLDLFGDVQVGGLAFEGGNLNETLVNSHVQILVRLNYFAKSVRARSSASNISSRVANGSSAATIPDVPPVPSAPYLMAS